MGARLLLGYFFVYIELLCMFNRLWWWRTVVMLLATGVIFTVMVSDVLLSRNLMPTELRLINAVNAQ